MSLGNELEIFRASVFDVDHCGDELFDEIFWFQHDKQLFAVFSSIDVFLISLLNELYQIFFLPTSVFLHKVLIFELAQISICWRDSTVFIELNVKKLGFSDRGFIENRESSEPASMSWGFDDFNHLRGMGFPLEKLLIELSLHLFSHFNEGILISLDQEVLKHHWAMMKNLDWVL